MSTNLQEKLQSQCPIHTDMDFKIQHLCYNKECSKKNTFLCSECAIQDYDIHYNHKQDLVAITPDRLLKNLQENKELKYQSLNSLFSCNIEDFSKKADDLINKLLDDLKTQLLDWKKVQIDTYKTYFLEKEKSDQKTQDLKEILLPVQKIENIFEELQKNLSIENMEIQGGKIKDLLWSDEKMQKQKEFQENADQLQKLNNVKDNFIGSLDFFKNSFIKNVQKNIQETQSKQRYTISTSQFLKLHLQDFTKNIQFKGLKYFKHAIEHNKNQQSDYEKLVELSSFNSNGQINFLNGQYKRCYSNTFYRDDLIIFKISCPTIKSNTQNNYLYFGLVDENHKKSTSHYCFGSGNWIRIDGSYSWKQFSYSCEQQGLLGKIEDNSELIIAIQPSSNIFSIFDTKSKIFAKNQYTFPSNIQKWTFQISDYYGKSVVVKKDPSEQDLETLILNNAL